MGPYHYVNVLVSVCSARTERSTNSAAICQTARVPRLFRRNGEDGYRARIKAARQQFVAGPEQRLQHRGTLRPPAPDVALVSASLSHDLTMVVLWTAPEDVAAAQATENIGDGVAVARGRAPWPYRAMLTWHGPAPRPPVVIEDLELAFPIVAPLPDGGLLIVATRSRVRDGVPERNAAFIGPTGFVERTGVIGDGVEDVQVTPSGRILVSYFDEGISGANGWGQPGLPPVGAAGLVEFSAMLQPIWRYGPQRGLPAIADCFAVNLVGESLWTCYYPGFPVVRVEPNMTTSYWLDAVRGANGLVVSGRRVGLVGGYPPYGDRLAVGRLEANRLEVISEARLVLPDGSELPANAQAMCRNDRLIVLVDREVFGLDLPDVITPAT